MAEKLRVKYPSHRTETTEDRSTEQMTFARTLVASHAKAGNIRQLTSTVSVLFMVQYRQQRCGREAKIDCMKA